jgi:microcystin-dependent protein
LANLKNQVSELTGIVENIQANAKFLTCGHPILMIQNADDVAAFNVDSGLGSECWEGWAICNGDAHYSANAKKNITTPNLLDKFVVCAGPTYPINTTGGAATVTLTESEIPAHLHAINDPGHLHAISDSGHDHGTTVGSHTHTITIAPHNHTLEADGSHTHTYQTIDSHVTYDGSGAAGASLTELTEGVNSQQNVNSGGSHTHVVNNTTATASASSESVSVDVNSANTGIEIIEQTTGITMEETGGGEAHENLPPYYSLIFVMKL